MIVETIETDVAVPCLLQSYERDVASLLAAGCYLQEAGHSTLKSSVEAVEDEKGTTQPVSHAAMTAWVPAIEPQFQTPQVISLLSWGDGAAKTPKRRGQSL